MCRIAERLEVTMHFAVFFLLHLLSLKADASHFRGAMTAWRVQKNYGNRTLLVNNFTTF